MIERWRPETHTFHLPFEEVTLTLQDVQVLIGLRVEGNPVVFPNLIHHNFDWAMMLQVHTRFTPAPDNFTRTSRLNIDVLIEYIRQQVHHYPITDKTPDDRVRRLARLYMLLILGAILFPNTSGNSLSLRFLNFVVDLGSMGNYSWGSTILAYLYWCFCWISIGGITLGGFLPLLQIWTWESLYPMTREYGVEIVNDIRRTFDQANLAFQGPTVPDEHYHQPLKMHGRGKGGRGCGCGDVAVHREGHRGGYGVFLHEGVGDVPLLPALEPEPKATVDDDPVGDHDQVHSSPFHSSPFTPDSLAFSEFGLHLVIQSGSDPDMVFQTVIELSSDT
ncbi:hypothetical protein P3S68_007391 [Capsicum galapagoense]